jgi:hypothetical protein
VNLIIQFLKQPFPYFQKKWQFVLVIAFSVAAVLAIVQIFLVEPVNVLSFAWFVGSYIIITAICTSIVVYLFPILFKRYFDERQWTRGKYFVFFSIIILMISVGNTLYDYFLLKNVPHVACNFLFTAADEITFLGYWCRELKFAFPIGIIPAAFGYFWLKNRGLHSNLYEKEDQNRKLVFRIQKNNVSDEKIITLTGNTKDTLTLFPRELLYLEAVGNYIKIHYQNNGQVSQKMLRVTMQQMEELLNDYPFLVRCHRSFIVNTHQIEKIKGLKLWLKSMDTIIPISKTCKANISHLSHF